MIVDYTIEGTPVDKAKYYAKGFVLKDLDVRKRKIDRTNSGENDFEVVCDFTGFLINEENDILTVFPKHFPVENETLELDSQLLFKVLMKAQNKTPFSLIGQNTTSNFQSDYPFESFFNVYNYFLEFGLLFEDKKRVGVKQNGKIKWKDTISRSEFFVENGKTFLFPFYYEKKYNFSTFLTEAMVFVIDYTLIKFKYFINLANTEREFPEFDFLGNREYVLEKLHSYREREFKDATIELLDSLIRFFAQLKSGGNYYLKHYSFKGVWESMVQEYLEGNFDSFTNGELILSSNVHTASFGKPRFYPNSFNEKHFFQPDYYFVDEKGNQIIFDAKYYFQTKGMNYKQICYNLFLEGYIGKEFPDKVNRGTQFPDTVIESLGHSPKNNAEYFGFIQGEREAGRLNSKHCNIFSALILPSEKRSRKQHFKLSSIYSMENTNLVISEEYFNIREVMQYFVDKTYVISGD